MNERRTKIVNVSLGARAYQIQIGHGCLSDFGGAMRAAVSSASRVIIVSNPTVDALYGQQLRNSCTNAGIEVETFLIADGEVHKTWATLDTILSAMLRLRLDRKCAVVALGGGVVGDIAGFAAAIYQRGVAFVQVPTTLLAQVDSSVGGKVAVNHPLGKNMVGAFHQPRLVYIDTQTLDSLPAREISAGLAEVVKYGFIGDAAFVSWLEKSVAALRTLEPATLHHAISTSCQMKADIVAKDETETGVRAHLNFGHTFGHAVEAGLGYGKWLHGEAVGAGMVTACALSERLGCIDPIVVERVRALVDAIGCPTKLPPLGAERYWDLMQLDKKSENKGVTFITLARLGEAQVRKGIEFERVRDLLP